MTQRYLELGVSESLPFVCLLCVVLQSGMLHLVTELYSSSDELAKTKATGEDKWS